MPSGTATSPPKCSTRSERERKKRMRRELRAVIAAAAFSLTVLVSFELSIVAVVGQVVTSCNPSLGSSECSTDTCCGQNGYCTAANCCTSRKCLENYAPPGYYYRDSRDHDESLSGKKSFGWWVQAAAGLTGVILIVILLCWFLSKCLSKF